MADVTRVRTTRSEAKIYRDRQGVEEVTRTERVRVSSIRSDRLDVSVLFDLVHALEVAGVKTGGELTAHRSDTGHLIQLVVEVDVQVPGAEEPAA